MTSEQKVRVPAVNRRVSWMIVGVAIASFVLSVLPLIPSIQELVPLSGFTRDGACVLYALVLLAFTGVAFPLVAREGDDGAKPLAWWWVGGLVLAFAGVPLYTLAYISGVSRDAVIEVLCWCGVLQALGLFCVRGQSRRGGLWLAFCFVLLFALPASEWLANILGLHEQRFTAIFSGRVHALTASYVEARLWLPLLLLIGSYALLFWGTRSKKTVLVPVFLLSAGLCFSSARMAVDDDFIVLSPTSSQWVPGRSTPLRIELGDKDQELTAELDSREVWTWRPEGGRRSLWLYPRFHRADEVLVLRDGAGQKRGEFRPKLLPNDRVIALNLGDQEVDVPLETMKGVDLARLAPSDVVADARFYDPFSLVFTSATNLNAMSSAQREALEIYCGAGGEVAILSDVIDARRDFGRGVWRRSTHKALKSYGSLATRRAPVIEVGLHERFSLPDWGRVDLGRLVLFLAVYHFVFLAIFLLPLLYDAKKSLTVYLLSVGFVLGLVVVGSYFALTRVFLAKKQILQQDFVVATQRAGRLDYEKTFCLASFNATAAQVRVRDGEGLVALFPNTRAGLGSVVVGGQGNDLVFENLPLDRFRKKQIFRRHGGSAAPFKVQVRPTGVRMIPTGIHDPLGISAAEPIRCLLREEGRLLGLRPKGGGFWVREDKPVILERIGGDDLDQALFLRYALTEALDPEENALIVLVSGLDAGHEGEDYLDRREILQVLLVPFSGQD